MVFRVIETLSASLARLLSEFCRARDLEHFAEEVRSKWMKSKASVGTEGKAGPGCGRAQSAFYEEGTANIQRINRAYSQ